MKGTTNRSEAINAYENKIHQKEVERKRQDDELYFQQLNEAEKIKFIIAFIAEVSNAAKFLWKIFDEVIEKLHRSEREFVASMQRYQADIKRTELAIQLANELAVQQQKIADLKAQLEQVKAYLENAIAMLNVHIDTVNKKYTTNANSLIDSTKAFISELPIQQFHDHNGIYDLKSYLQGQLEVVYDKLRQRQIEPRNFKNEVITVVNSCVATFIKKMNIADHKARQSIRATITKLIDESSQKLENKLDSQVDLINSLQADHIAIANAEKIKSSLTDKVEVLKNAIGNLADTSQTLEAQKDEQVNPDQFERTCSTLGDLAKSVSHLSKSTIEELDDLSDFLQSESETPKLTSATSLPAPDTDTDSDSDSAALHRHGPGAG